jgi:hypothetical protein
VVSKVTIKVEGLREIENAARADQPARAETVRGDGGLVREFPLIGSRTRQTAALTAAPDPERSFGNGHDEPKAKHFRDPRVIVRHFCLSESLLDF